MEFVYSKLKTFPWLASTHLKSIVTCTWKINHAPCQHTLCPQSSKHLHLPNENIQESFAPTAGPDLSGVKLHATLSKHDLANRTSFVRTETTNQRCWWVNKPQHTAACFMANLLEQKVQPYRALLAVWHAILHSLGHESITQISISEKTD